MGSFTFSILTETAGSVKFDDLRPGLTIEEQVDEVTGLSQLVVTLPRATKSISLAILIRDSSGKVRKEVTSCLPRPLDGPGWR